MPDHQHPFDRLASRAPRDIRLGEAALLIAIDHCSDVDVALWLRRLDALARRVDRLGARTAEERVEALRTVLVDEEGLSGNRDDYYDPRNSFLHELLRRRKGIPIALSAIWLDVAEQLGWPLAGVGLPGHFVLRYADGESELFVDAFDAGRRLTRADCRRLVVRAVGREVELTDDDFAPVGVKPILTRMLNNLRGVFVHQQKWYNALCVVSRLRALHPDDDDLRAQATALAKRQAELN